MKKTLIALMATSSMAMATVSLEDADITMAGNTGYNTQSNNFTVALTLDVTELQTLLEKGQTPCLGD